MSVIITSFEKSKKIKKGLKYSISAYQPYGFYYDSLKFLAPYNIYGKKLRLRDGGLEYYKKELIRYYVSRWDNVSKWLKSLSNDEIYVLCCWCPYSRAGKRQINEYGTFVCHTGIVGKLILKYRPDIDLYLDCDRAEKLHPDYKPKKYKIISI